MKMIIEIPTTKIVDVKYVTIRIPIYDYMDEEIPKDFPLRDGDEWKAMIDLETHQIRNWAQGESRHLYIKVSDGGVYSLMTKDFECVAMLTYEYVPRGVIPGRWGDYIDLQIDETGKVVNMPQKLNFDEFFKKDDLD